MIKYPEEVKMDCINATLERKTNEYISYLIMKGDEEFAKGNRWEAKEYYAKAKKLMFGECEGNCETCEKGRE
jgi:predicted negative regulator of RcsB-dependent stress response